MIKKISIGFILFVVAVSAQTLEFGQVKGLFMSVGVGPRIPLGEFAGTNNVGVGFNAALSYTDNKLLPLFFYSDIGFQHMPGSQEYYKTSDHASISSNMIIMNLGGRYFYSPLVENIVLLMPIIEAGLSLSYSETSHILKRDSGRNNFIEDEFNVGFHIGAGFSMFLMDVVTHYHYFRSKQYISFDLRVRIPIIVSY